MVNSEHELSNTVGKTTRQPGFAYQVIKPEIAIDFLTVNWHFNIAIPLAGIDYPTAPRFGTGIAGKWNFLTRRQ